jgi:hypothetical protein
VLDNIPGRLLLYIYFKRIINPTIFFGGSYMTRLNAVPRLELMQRFKPYMSEQNALKTIGIVEDVILIPPEHREVI